LIEVHRLPPLNQRSAHPISELITLHKSRQVEVRGIPPLNQNRFKDGAPRQCGSVKGGPPA
jgi:hypothetical protein